MSTHDPLRQPAGTPSGGQFAPDPQAATAAPVALTGSGDVELAGELVQGWARLVQREYGGEAATFTVSRHLEPDDTVTIRVAAIQDADGDDLYRSAVNDPRQPFDDVDEEQRLIDAGLGMRDFGAFQQVGAEAGLLTVDSDERYPTYRLADVLVSADGLEDDLDERLEQFAGHAVRLEEQITRLRAEQADLAVARVAVRALRALRADRPATVRIVQDEEDGSLYVESVLDGSGGEILWRGDNFMLDRRFDEELDGVEDLKPFLDTHPDVTAGMDDSGNDQYDIDVTQFITSNGSTP